MLIGTGICYLCERHLRATPNGDKQVHSGIANVGWAAANLYTCRKASSAHSLHALRLSDLLQLQLLSRRLRTAIAA